jgi:hypothetical protein
MVLPAMGVVSELIATFARKPVFGYSFVAGSTIAIAVLEFLVWGHHMFVSGQSAYSALAFSFLSYLVAIPLAVKVCSGQHRSVHDWGPDRAYSRQPGAGYARPRHLFCRRPFPLHHGGRLGEWLSGRPPLLVA